MTASEDIDITLSDLSCRILVVSSSIEQATSVIHLIRNRAQSQSASVPSELFNDVASSSGLPGSSSGLMRIPWTITNRYYSARVHFAAHPIRGLSPHQVKNIPAVIFSWAHGESYRHHIERISKDLADCEPEVCLAVRILPGNLPSSPSLEPEDQHEDDNEIDAFLSLHGFEYIDATQEDSLHHSDDAHDAQAYLEDIPGLPRILDALSTIMWPSMQTRSKDSTSLETTRLREQALLEWARRSQGNSLSIVEEIVVTSNNQHSDGVNSMGHEIQELARWLEQDESLREDPWKSAASSNAMSMSPTAVDFGDETPRAEKSEEPAVLGFEDDFTVFVSAPAHEAADGSGYSTLDISTSGLALPHAGDLYRSLGSVSDFGGSDDEKANDDGDEDYLPTQKEILATSSRIYGATKVTTSLLSKSHNSAVEPTPLSSDASRPAVKLSPGASTDLFLEGFPSDIEVIGVDSYDMAPFDLSRVLSALQEMKAEISSMDDEEERRKTAAKVALGLVYGLEADL